jgi:hypothetical protein
MLKAQYYNFRLLFWRIHITIEAIRPALIEREIRQFRRQHPDSSHFLSAYTSFRWFHNLSREEAGWAHRPWRGRRQPLLGMLAVGSNRKYTRDENALMVQDYRCVASLRGLVAVAEQSTLRIEL